jgi:hypothetical protein
LAIAIGFIALALVLGWLVRPNLDDDNGDRERRDREAAAADDDRNGDAGTDGDTSEDRSPGQRGPTEAGDDGVARGPDVGGSPTAGFDPKLWSGRLAADGGSIDMEAWPSTSTGEPGDPTSGYGSPGSSPAPSSGGGQPADDTGSSAPDPASGGTTPPPTTTSPPATPPPATQPPTTQPPTTQPPASEDPALLDSVTGLLGGVVDLVL